MAYLRKEDETVETDYSLDKVWTTIQKVLKGLEWHVEQIDETARHIKAKSRAGPMSFSSLLQIDVTPVDENTTRVTVASETPVTTITAIVDFRQGKRRILQFLGELAKQLAT
jgi:hypothetical protein